MAVSSYLADAAGGVVVGALFDDDDPAHAAIGLLRASGVRSEDISVVAADRLRASAIAGHDAWTPWRVRGAMSFLTRLLAGRDLPREVRARYGGELRAGRVLLLVAADGQPPDTVAALYSQAGGSRIEQWWQAPADLFAPPELAGPF